MRLGLRFLHLSIAIGMVVLLSGCQLRTLHVVIPDFDAASVDGLEVFRLDDATGQPVDAGGIQFLGVQASNDGAELLEYALLSLDGTVTSTITAQVIRDVANPDAVEVFLIYHNQAAAGWYKVASYNGEGSSELSLTQTFLQ